MKSLFLFVIVFTTQTLWAKETWRYTAFPVLSKNLPQKQNEPEVLKVGKKKLRAVMSRQSGTHRLWGVEQVYLSKDLKKRVFVKYKVQLNSKNPIGGWIKFPEAHLLHLKKGKDIVAYVAQGFNNLELYELQKQLQGSKVAQQAWPNPFMNCAHAEEVTTDAMGNVAYSTTAGVSPVDEQSMIVRAANVMTCVGSETIDGAIEKGKALWENATWDNIKTGVGSAASAAWEAVPSAEEVGAGFRATGNYIQAAWEDPSIMVKGVTERFDNTVQIIAQLTKELGKQIKDFYNLPSEYQDQIACDMIAEFAANGVLSAALAAVATGGVLTAVTLTKAIYEVRKYSRKIALLMRAIGMIQGSDLPMDDQMAKLNMLLKGQMSPAEVLLDGNGPVDIRAANATMRSRNNNSPEKTAMLQEAGALNDVDRLATAARELSRPLTRDQERALLAAHRVAPERGYLSYTPEDLKQKREILMRANFSPDETEYLLRRGLAGQQAPDARSAAASTAAGAGERLSYQKLFYQTTGERDSFGRPKNELSPDIPMSQVPAMSSEIRKALNSGMARPEHDGEASRLGEILLRDFGTSRTPSKARAEELSRHLEQLGYPTENGLKWPLSSESAMETMSRIPVNSPTSLFVQRRGASQLAVTQIVERIGELSDSIRRRGMGISDSEAEQTIRELRQQKQKLDNMILQIDNQLLKTP